MGKASIRAVRAVVLDADGVMQRNPDGWLDEMTRHVSPDDRGGFAADVFATEQEAMTGRRRFADVLDEVSGRWGIRERAVELRRHWRRVEASPEMVDLVRSLRRAGVPCHLATNQNDERAAYLRHDLGYGDLFDRMFVSCELGVLKSDPVFFDRVVRGTGSPAGALLFVDDTDEYAETARLAGLQAATWCLADGLDELLGVLADHGIRPSPAPGEGRERLPR